MECWSRIVEDLCAVEGLTVRENAPLSEYTRFGLGGPASVLAESEDEAAFLTALRYVRGKDLPRALIGAGTNLIVADAGFHGVVLRFSGARMEARGTEVFVESGAVLWDLVDFTIAQGSEGLETMAAIPGWAGAAIYGNAGAYGRSIADSVHRVRFLDGDQVREFSNAECQFLYRESIFKKHKEWFILSALLRMKPADPAKLRGIADGIVAIRNEKFPPTMKCAGSIFKNLMLADLPQTAADAVPQQAVREGKVPSAWFLEQVGARGRREGGIHIAGYHANLIYNDGTGTSEQLCLLIDDLKERVEDRFGIRLEEEVQYVGFPPRQPLTENPAARDAPVDAPIET